MQKIYQNHPEISQLKANIISRRSQGDDTQIILDRTIFMPKSTFLLEDHGNISGLPLLSVEEKRDNIIHLVKGKPQKSEVILNLDMDNRYKNLAYNTTAVLFEMILQAFYNFKDVKFEITYDKAILIVHDFNDIFDEKLIEDQMNFIIQKSIPIDNHQGITSLYPLGEVINNDISFNNTSKVRGFKILSHEFKGNNLNIEIFAGSDILN